MANEAVILSLFGSPAGEPVRYDVYDTQAIEKGTLMFGFGAGKCSGSIAATSGTNFVGIASTEKVANDGSTSIGLFTKGIFGLKSFGVITNAGTLAILSGANCIGQAAGFNDILSGAIVGKYMRNAASGDIVPVIIGSGVY